MDLRRRSMLAAVAARTGNQDEQDRITIDLRTERLLCRRLLVLHTTFNRPYRLSYYIGPNVCLSSPSMPSLPQGRGPCPPHVGFYGPRWCDPIPSPNHSYPFTSYKRKRDFFARSDTWPIEISPAGDIARALQLSRTPGHRAVMLLVCHTMRLSSKTLQRLLQEHLRGLAAALPFTVITDIMNINHRRRRRGSREDTCPPPKKKSRKIIFRANVM